MMLSSTSALVLLLTGKECYSSKKARAFFDCLDLNSGLPLVEGLSAFYDHYDVVLHYRKYAINRLLDGILMKNPQMQVVIAASGLDPFGLDLVSRYQCPLYEFDVANMDVKREMLPDAGIAFLTVDLCQEDSVYKILLSAGWDPQKPTCLIYEGISYYVSMKATQNLFSTLKPDYIVFEYLRKDHEMSKPFCLIAKQTFDLIKDICHMKDDVTSYASDSLLSIFARPVLQEYNMHDLEHLQEKGTHYFPEADCGWISLALLGS